MKIYFNNKYLEELAYAKPKGKTRYSFEVVNIYRRKLIILRNVRNSTELRMFKSLHFERLQGNKKRLYSIRVNEKYRLEFSLNKKMNVIVEEIIVVEELSNHYK